MPDQELKKDLREFDSCDRSDLFEKQSNVRFAGPSGIVQLKTGTPFQR
jgi:hypothetical protein